MISGHYFRRIRSLQSSCMRTDPPDYRTLLALLSHDVVKRFACVGKLGAPVVALDLWGSQDTEDPPANPGHPACAEYAGSDYCGESWQLHLADLKRRPETHWHKCDYGRLCAIVPIVYQDRCLAAVKLACPASVAEEDFERHVELLDVLTRGFVISNADFLGRLLCAELPATGPGASPPERTEEDVERRPSHPQVLDALRYIEEHLCDPKLTVGRTAHELDINPNYLSQLFADQIGQRMSRFIAARRVELAKTLLTTTDWQIKRIARETGHANPNWFCHIFGVHTGLAPRAYRRTSRVQSHAGSKR